MGIVVGGEKAWKVRTQGDLVVAYHWINREPAMVLFPLRRRLGAVPFVIPLPAAYTYARSNGYPTMECFQKAFIAARVMAMDVTRTTIHSIVTVILDGLEDLIKMPPEPPVLVQRLPNVGEIALMLDGKPLVQGEIDDVPVASLH
jgi:hypothetical protein